jgi:hypothetical protein
LRALQAVLHLIERAAGLLGARLRRLAKLAEHLPHEAAKAAAGPGLPGLCALSHLVHDLAEKAAETAAAQTAAARLPLPGLSLAWLLADLLSGLRTGADKRIEKLLGVKHGGVLPGKPCWIVQMVLLCAM